MTTTPTPERDSPQGRRRREPSVEENPASLRRRVAHLERELAIIRRYVHALDQAAGRPPTKFFNMPKYGKLRYRPVLLGFSPTAGCRSGLPFDDAHGDHLAEVMGLSSYQQLLCNFKIRNIFTHPAEDLFHDARGDDAMRRTMRRHVGEGLFDGRVVIVAGRDAQRAAGLDVAPGYVGPLGSSSEHFARAALVIALPDIGHPSTWPRERRQEVWNAALLAMTAARLPCPDPVAVAMRLAANPGAAADDPCWRGFSTRPYPDTEHGRGMWRALVELGLAAPPNLTREAWLPLGPARAGFELHTTGGSAHLMVSDDNKSARVDVYTGWPSPVSVFTAKGRAGDLRRKAENFMFERRGWDYPFRALDNLLDKLRS